MRSNEVNRAIKLKLASEYIITPEKAKEIATIHTDLLKRRAGKQTLDCTAREIAVSENLIKR